MVLYNSIIGNLFRNIIFYFIHFLSVTRVSGVKIRKLEVPEMAQAGHEVHLLCDYDLERARLYQVNRYSYYFGLNHLKILYI